MIGEKILRFQGKNKDLSQVAQQIEKRLQSEGYRTQSASLPLGTVIQAEKPGILREIITAERAFSILVSGEPNDFTVHIGIGNWIQNLAVAAVETLFLSMLFLAIDVPEMLWTVHVEKGIAEEISVIVNRA